MKTELKGWLADNTVTVDNKENKILALESPNNLTLSNVLDEMREEHPIAKIVKTDYRNLSVHNRGFSIERIFSQAK